MSERVLTLDSNWLDIANRALALIGCAALTSFSEASKEAQTVTRILTSSVSDVYSQYNWKIARKKEELSCWETDIPGEYCFSYPPDFGRLEQVICDGEWYADAKGIVTKAQQVFLVYRAIPTMAEDMTPTMANLVTLRLAADLAMPLTHSEGLKQMCEQKYETAYAKAVLLDNVPHYEDVKPVESYTEARERVL